MEQHLECRLDPREDSGFRGKQYFTSELLPKKLKARSFRLEGERVYENREDAVILYIRRGRGTAFLNNREYALEPGALLILCPFHIRRILAAGEAPLEGEECVLNMGALLFLFAIPPYRRPVPLFETAPFLCRLDADIKRRVEAIWDRLLQENENMDCYCGKMQFALFMRIMALCRKYGKIPE